MDVMFIPRVVGNDRIHVIPVGNDCIYKVKSWQARFSARDARSFSPSTIQDLLASVV